MGMLMTTGMIRFSSQHVHLLKDSLCLKNPWMMLTFDWNWDDPLPIM